MATGEILKQFCKAQDSKSKYLLIINTYYYLLILTNLRK